MLATSNSYRDGVEILSIVCGQMEKILHRTLSAEMLQKGDDMIRKQEDVNSIKSKVIQNLENSLMGIVTNLKIFITMQIIL